MIYFLIHSVLSIYYWGILYNSICGIRRIVRWKN
nr:MAG TPA: hypothetical protein [Caudoviricetes sp.]